MANNMVKLITINGATYEVSEWFGVCSTSSSTQTKSVTINGFSTNSLVNGTRVTVRFDYAQSYHGTPLLNVNSTGARSIFESSTVAGYGAWSAGEVVTFIYYSGGWYIEKGGKATVSTYGVTRLTSYFGDNDISLAASSSLTYQIYRNIMTNCQWDARDHDSTTIYSTTTPSASSWNDLTENYKSVDISYDLSDYITNTSSQRFIKITFHNIEFFFELNPFESTFGFYYYDEDTNITFEIYDDNCIITAPSEEAGAYTFKMELYKNYSEAGLVAYPTLKHYLDNKGYLTLADLPIYDGSVT